MWEDSSTTNSMTKSRKPKFINERRCGILKGNSITEEFSAFSDEKNFINKPASLAVTDLPFYHDKI